VSYEFITGNCLKVMAGMPAESVDLVFFSPPYEDARTYGIDYRLKGQEWVDWMVKVFAQCQRVCTGLVACVCQGRTRQFSWSAVPALLIADLSRAGFNLRNPPIFSRVGIPGSGGPDWLRSDYEWIVCTSRPGKLPWSDNTVMGHPPKWGSGGEMSYRQSDGTRRNAWGSNSCNERTQDGSGNGNASVKKLPKVRLGRGQPKGTPLGRRVSRGSCNGDTITEDAYLPPKLANPGNVIECLVGGGVMGDKACHESEAPFPEKLAEFFIRSFAKPYGRVLDPTSGSGTTVAVAHRLGRQGIGIELREAQNVIAMARCGRVTPELLAV
jgi:hypothetical protein